MLDKRWKNKMVIFPETAFELEKLAMPLHDNGTWPNCVAHACLVNDGIVTAHAHSLQHSRINTTVNY